MEDYRNLRIAIQAMTVFSRSRYLLTTSHFHRKTTAPALRFKLFSYYQELKKKKKVWKYSLLWLPPSMYLTFSVFQMDALHLETMFYGIHVSVLVWHFYTMHYS